MDQHELPDNVKEVFEDVATSRTFYADWLRQGGDDQQDRPTSKKHWSLVRFLEAQEGWTKVAASTEDEDKKDAWRADLDASLAAHMVPGMRMDMSFEEAATAFYGERGARVAAVFKGLGKNHLRGVFWFEVAEELLTPENTDSLDLPSNLAE